MSIYTKEFLIEEAIKSMNKSGVSEEVQDLFKQKMWDETYNNMLSQKGLFFVLTFLNDTEFYSAHFDTVNFSPEKLKEKLNEQGFIFYIGKPEGYNNYSDDNIFIIEPMKEFKEKVAFFGGINSYLEGL